VDKTPAWYLQTSDEMKISNFSSLARTIDPRYPTNLAILIISTLSGGVLFLVNYYQGIGLQQSIVAAITIGLTLFLTWALGREIDPEHEISAFTGAALAVPGYLFFDVPSFFAVLSMVLVLRMINRTTGVAPRLIDSLAVLGLGSLLTILGNWIFGLLTAAAFFLDSRLPSPKRQHIYYSGIMMVISIGTIIILNPPPPQFNVELGEVIFITFSILVFIPLNAASREIDLACDFTDEKINPQRLQTSQIFSFSAALSVWLLNGISGFSDLLPLWAAILGVSLTFLSTSLYNKIRKI
jgi:hypothetical protein